MNTRITVRRFDRAKLGKATRLDNGFIRAPSRLARTGVLEYTDPSNPSKIWRELRLPEDVFATDSMDSFAMKPLVNDHPVINQGVVDSTNARQLAVGTVGAPFRDGRFMCAELMITDAQTVSDVENGKRELSCGYFCDREPAPPGAIYIDAETGDKSPYDFIQRNIRGNHVALVSHGRAGPEVRIALDSGDAVQVDSQPQAPRKANLMKITIHGIEFDVDASVAQAIAAERQINADALNAVKTNAAGASKALAETTARADMADTKVKELSAKVSELNDPKTVAALVASRVALEGKARAVLGGEFKFDGLTDSEIKAAALKKNRPALTLDGKSADYINAAFDLLSADAPQVNPLTAAADVVIKADGNTPAPAAPANRADRRKNYNQTIFATDAATAKPSRAF